MNDLYTCLSELFICAVFVPSKSKYVQCYQWIILACGMLLTPLIPSLDWNVLESLILFLNHAILFMPFIHYPLIQWLCFHYLVCAQHYVRRWENNVKQNVCDGCHSYFQFSGMNQQSYKQYWKKCKSCRPWRPPQSAVVIHIVEP